MFRAYSAMSMLGERHSVSCMTSFIEAHIIESSRFIFVLMTLNFATLTTLLTFRPTWHTPHWEMIKWYREMIKWSQLLLANPRKKSNLDFCVGIMDFSTVHFCKFPGFLQHSYNVSTFSVDLSSKLTGLRTSGKHAKPQRASLKFRVPAWPHPTGQHQPSSPHFFHPPNIRHYISPQNIAVLVLKK